MARAVKKQRRRPRRVPSRGRTPDIQEIVQALRESEDRLIRTQRIAHLGSWELDLKKGMLTWSDEAYRIFGMRPGTFKPSYKAFLQHIHPEDRKAVDTAYKNSLREGKDKYAIDHRIIRKGTGEIRWVQEKCRHDRGAAAGEPDGGRGIPDRVPEVPDRGVRDTLGEG